MIHSGDRLSTPSSFRTALHNCFNRLDMVTLRLRQVLCCKNKHISSRGDVSPLQCQARRLAIFLAFSSVSRRTCWAHVHTPTPHVQWAPRFVPRLHSGPLDPRLPRDFDYMLVSLGWPATTKFAMCCETSHEQTASAL